MSPPELVEYFGAERQGGFVLVALALLSFAAATALVLSRRMALYRAMAWPLLAFGLVEASVGAVVAYRTPAQVVAIAEGLRTSRSASVTAEMQRIRKVDSSFEFLKIGEVAVIAVGLILVAAAPRPGRWAAVGLGLLLESGALLIFDLFAHERALVYERWLQGFAA